MVDEQQGFNETNIIPPDGDDEKQLWLQKGWPLNFTLPDDDLDSPEAKSKRTIQAVWLENLAASADGAIQVPINISNAIIEGNLNLKYVNFEQEVLISNSDFLGSCDFSFATFNRTISFIASQFHQKSFFRSSNAKCDFVITRTQFHNDAQFVQMNIGALLSAEGANFQDADFSFIKVTTIANFNPINYEGRFIPVNFIGEASFFGAEFLGAAAFRGAQFKKTAKFEGLNVGHLISFNTFVSNDEVIHTFLNNANFNRARIQGGASFTGVVFNEYTSFTYAQIGGAADFSAIKNEECIPTTFNGEVNFSGTVFKDNLLFDGTQFAQKADFTGIQVGGLAGFKSTHSNNNLLTTFNGEVSFWRAVFEGSVHFNGVQFLKKANFNGIQVQEIALFKPIDASDAVFPVRFGGDATFNGAQFRDAFFDGTSFMNNAVFLETRFNGDAYFRGFDKEGSVTPMLFSGDVNFIDAHFEVDVFFNGAQFNKKAYFSHALFNNGAYFMPLQTKSEVIPVQFSGDANFIDAHFKGNADFSGAQFKDDSIFQQSRIEQDIQFGPAIADGQVLNTRFEGKSNFNMLVVQDNAVFTGAHFMGDASFVRMYVGKNTLFDSSIYENKIVPSQFDNDVDFSGTHFLGTAKFIGTKFKSNAIFESVQFESNARFLPYINDGYYEQVSFNGSALFSSSVFKRQADFRGADFIGRVDFRRVEINGAALFIGVSFKNAVSFREANFNIGIFKEDFGSGEAWSDINRDSTVHIREIPKQFYSRVDMRGFSYERIYVNWEELFGNLSPYDRQPYFQLEKMFRLAGHDRQAEDIYKARRTREGKRLWNKVFRRGEFKNLTELEALRELPAALSDKSQQLLFNYGVRPYRLIFISLLVICIGTFIFSRPGAVIHKDKDARSTHEGELQLSKSEAFNVSLHQFVPVVEITPGGEWTPSKHPIFGLRALNISYAGYDTFHRLAGAILVPLGIVVLTGLLFRREKNG